MSEIDKMSMVSKMFMLYIIIHLNSLIRGFQSQEKGWEEGDKGFSL